MGREIRKVPPNWEHPKYTSDNATYRDRIGSYMPMYDDNFNDKFAEWLADFDRIRRNEMTDFERKYYPDGLRQWLVDDGAPPNPDYYRPYADEDATWFQVYETVSEGTPVTPPFAIREELVEYLIQHGDFWQQKRWQDGDRFMQPERPGYSRANAEAFVLGDGYAPSMVVIKSASGTEIFDGINSVTALSNGEERT